MFGLAGTLAFPGHCPFAPRSEPRRFMPFVPGFLAARARSFPWLTAHSQPPAVARYSLPSAGTGEAQILDPRSPRCKTSSVLPACDTPSYFPVGIYILPSATSIEPHLRVGRV